LLQAGLEPKTAEAELKTAAYSPSGSSFVPPTPEALQPAFPQLEIIELLGKGGMGAVYKARQPGLDRLVAVKILPPDVSQDPAFAERFKREARALAMLNHPNIVGVYDSGNAGGYYYFVMEFLDGVNLRQAMRAGQLKAAEALKIVPQICDALQFAHDEGIVHRDIKPENILLDKKGRVKIADFGLAKLLGKTQDVTLTGTQQMMGTLHYMAPEQLEGARDVDHRADIYSLGVTFYEMLTGELPIGRFAAPSKKVQIDVRLDEVVLRSLEKAPEQRYQHASEIKTEMEAIVQSPGASTASPAPRYDATVGLPMALLGGAYVMLSIVAIFTGLFVVIPGGIFLLVSFAILNVVWLVRRKWAQRRTAAAKTEPPPAARHALWPRLATIAVCLLAAVAGLAPIAQRNTPFWGLHGKSIGDGFQVTQVWPGSPADRSGLRRDDYIEAINAHPLQKGGQKPMNAGGLRTLIALDVGEKATLTVRREHGMDQFEVAGEAPPVAMVYYQDYWHPVAGCLGMLLGAFALAAGGLARSGRGVIVLTTGLVIGIGFIVVVVGRSYGIDWSPIDIDRSSASWFLSGLDHSQSLHWQTYLGLAASVALIALGVAEILPASAPRPISASAPTESGEPAPSIAARLFRCVRKFAVSALVALGVYLAVFAGMVKATGQDVAVGTAIGAALLTLAAFWVYRNFGFAFVRPYLPYVWTSLCVILFVMLWTPYETNRAIWSGYLDGSIWPYHHITECAVSLEPKDPTCKRMVIREKAEISRNGYEMDYRNPRQPDRERRIRLIYDIELQPMQGEPRHLVVDAMNGMSWTAEGRGGSILDAAALTEWLRSNDPFEEDLRQKKAAGWVFDPQVGWRPPPGPNGIMQPDDPDEKPRKIENPEATQKKRQAALALQARDVVDIIQLASRDPQVFYYMAWGGGARTSRLQYATEGKGSAMGRGDAFVRGPGWNATESERWQPVVPILYVGAPLMLAVWAVGLWLLLRWRHKTS
jgi:predicted Ser/Thr protein kinase